ncbi:MAG: hypothetical protein RJB66_1259 [Pseudomonadota bacterium]|jgi:ABC-type dipeptide/oligopeptide/nickel transport system permease component
MTSAKIGKLAFQILITTVAVMGIVIGLLNCLPDFATYDSDTSLSEQSELARPSFWSQNRIFWINCLRQDFGASRVNTNYSVGEIIRRDSSVSISLFLLSMTISIIGGGFLGLFSAVRMGTRTEALISYAGLFISTLPTFLIVPLLIYFFSIRWNLLPSALWEGAKAMVLPTIALSVRPIFFLTRIFRDQLIKTSRSEFVLTAYAKGLRPASIWMVHILPNSLRIFVTASGNLFGQIVSSLFLVELLFALPGLGSLFVKSLMQRDYPLFLGVVLVFTLTLQIGHRLAEIINSFISREDKIDQEFVR